jgi:hypothetical protein
MALNDFTYYANRNLGGIGAEEIDSDRAQAMLAELQKYDPTASFRPTFGNEGSLTGYTLDFDASKLPGLDGGLLGGTSGHGSGGDYLPRFSTVQDQMQLTDPNAVRDSDIYGKVTDNTNIAQPATTMDWLGPLLVGAFGFGIGGIPGLTEGFGAQFQAPGGMDLSGLGASDPFLQGGTGAMDMAGSAGTGIPGSEGFVGADPWDLMGDPSAYGLGGGAPVDPWDVMGDPKAYGLGGTQTAAPITDLSTPARVGDVIRNGGLPGLDNIWQSLKELPIGSIAKALPGLTGGSKPNVGLLGGGGGGNNLLAIGGGQQKQVEDASAILKRFYESGLLGRA